MSQPESDQQKAMRMAKAELRARVLARVEAMTLEECRQGSVKLCELLEEQECWQQAKTVLFYAPMLKEPDLSRLLTDALASGKAVALPRFDREKKIYAAALIKAEADLATGYYGIREPAGHCPAVGLNRLDFVLVPGVAFDWNGFRLGRGKGYYDRLLAEFDGWTCGVAFDPQVVGTVPSEPHDMRLTCLVTPTRWQIITKPRPVLK